MKAYTLDGGKAHPMRAIVGGMIEKLNKVAGSSPAA